MRILTAREKNDLQVVDSDIFEFGNRVEPLTLDIDDLSVGKLKLEIRYIYQVSVNL